MIGGPLERSLPVVNGEFFPPSWDGWSFLERSLPVATWDFNGFLQKLGRLGFLRTLATGSEWVILLKIGMMGGP